MWKGGSINHVDSTNNREDVMGKGRFPLSNCQINCLSNGEEEKGKTTNRDIFGEGGQGNV